MRESIELEECEKDFSIDGLGVYHFCKECGAYNSFLCFCVKTGNKSSHLPVVFSCSNLKY